MAKGVYLPECFIALEAKKKGILSFFLILSSKFSGEWRYLAISYSICNFLRNLGILYLVLITRHFPENYKSGSQAAVTKIKTSFMYKNYCLWNTGAAANLSPRAHKAGKVVVSSSAVLTGIMLLPSCPCLKVQQTSCTFPSWLSKSTSLSLNSPKSHAEDPFWLHHLQTQPITEGVFFLQCVIAWGLWDELGNQYSSGNQSIQLHQPKHDWPSFCSQHQGLLQCQDRSI